MKIMQLLVIAALVTASFLTASTPAVFSPADNYILVTTIADEYDAGVDDGDCSLREAITAAVTDVPFGGCVGGSAVDDDWIDLDIGTYTLERDGVDDANEYGDLDINTGAEGAIFISGEHPSATRIHGNGLDRIFRGKVI